MTKSSLFKVYNFHLLIMGVTDLIHLIRLIPSNPSNSSNQFYGGGRYSSTSIYKTANIYAIDYFDTGLFRVSFFNTLNNSEYFVALTLSGFGYIHEGNRTKNDFLIFTRNSNGSFAHMSFSFQVTYDASLIESDDGGLNPKKTPL